MLQSNDEIRKALRRIDRRAPKSEALRFARAVWCDETPGLAFALFTLAWILTSFAGLAGFHLKPLGDHMMAEVHRLSFYLPAHLARMLSRAGTVAGVAKRGWDLFAAKDCA